MFYHQIKIICKPGATSSSLSVISGFFFVKAVVGHNNGYMLKMFAVSGMIIFRFVEDMNGGDLRHEGKRPG